MRGKDFLLLDRLFAKGITLAYAGKSSAQVNVKAVKEDHPRVCGEKDLGGLALTVVKGSPPRMRGKAYDPEGRARRRRITPAYAGKSRHRCSNNYV